MHKTLLTLPAFLLATLVGQAAQVETYQIDPVHSSIKFKIRHFIAKTTGHFSDFSGSLRINRDDLTQSSAEATIQVPSVNTDNAKRDAHLQEDDFFNAAQHPLMLFKSTAWEATNKENIFKVTGDLSFHGVTNSVTLDVELLGFGEGARGAQLSGWEAHTTLDRNDWGIDGGKPAVGDEVEITINIEAFKE